MSLRSPVQVNNPRGSVIVTQPAIEPVTAAEFKAHVRDDALTDPEALAWVTIARAYIEKMNNLACITQTWRLALDMWPAGKQVWWDGWRQGSRAELYGPASYSAVILPRYPLASIDSVTTYDTADDPTSITVATTFNVDTYRTPGRVTLKSGATWPTALRETNGIEIDYIAGYGSAATDVPTPLRQAILMMAAYIYEHRGDGCTPGDAYKISGAQGLADIYKSKAI